MYRQTHTITNWINNGTRVGKLTPGHMTREYLTWSCFTAVHQCEGLVLTEVFESVCQGIMDLHKLVTRSIFLFPLEQKVKFSLEPFWKLHL